MRALIRGIDALLCRAYGIFDISDDPDFLLRLQIGKASHELRFSNRVVAEGEPVLIIHLWNEHLQTISPQGPDLAWAKKMYRAFETSLQQAADWIEEDPNARGIAAVGAITYLIFAGPRANGARMMERLGFTLMPYNNPLGRFGLFWENFYSWLLIWTYNPGDLQAHKLTEMHRDEMWMPVDDFLRRFGENSFTPAVQPEKER